MEKIRSFIAVEIPAPVRKLLEDTITSLRAANTAPVKWVEPQNIHLTLKFLGDIDASGVDSVLDVLRESVEGFISFDLEAKELGVFPNERRPRVAWVGLSGDIASLNRLQQNIENGLEKIGYPKENRKFSPHLTIGRVRDRVTSMEQQAFGELVKKSFISPEKFTIGTVHLFKSQLTRQGPIYTQLGSFIIS